MTSKGQLTVPKEVRDRLGLRAGSRVRFAEVSEGTWTVVVAARPPASLAGMLHREGRRAVTVEEMNQAVRDEAAARNGAALA
jgi:AbrB family looped-hinge helix DNA binding protein